MSLRNRVDALLRWPSGLKSETAMFIPKWKGECDQKKRRVFHLPHWTHNMRDLIVISQLCLELEALVVLF